MRKFKKRILVVISITELNMHNYREFSRKNLVLIIIFCLIFGCSRKTDNHYNELGVNYLNNGQYDYAINALKKAIKLNPSNAEVHFNLGRAYNRKGMDDKARAEFSISSRIDPETFDKCVIKYKEKIDYELTDAQYLAELGNAYAEKGMLDEAITTYQKVLEVQPGNYRIHYDLGMVYLKKGLYNGAVGEFKNAIEINPGMPEAHYNLGMAYYKQGMIEMAISEYKSTLGLLPDAKGRKTAGVHYKLGLAYYDNGMFEDAINELNKALIITPNDSRVHYQLSMVYKKIGMVKQEEEELDIYKKLKKK
ncbi:MAG: tetratricopeptide repeat protein [Candidatus Scalinduaceae bacterium]